MWNPSTYLPPVALLESGDEDDAGRDSPVRNATRVVRMRWVLDSEVAEQSLTVPVGLLGDGSKS